MGRRTRGWRRVWMVVAGVIVGLQLGCSAMVTSMSNKLTDSLADNLSAAIVNHNDPATVREGGPAYLIMVDSFINGNPESVSLLLTGANLYSSFAGSFVEDEHRSQVLATTGKRYGLRALCLTEASTCDLSQAQYEEFDQVVSRLGKEDVPALYGAAAAWATWIQVNRSDWVAIADKARVQAMMQRVIELDEGYANGRAHLYLGVLATLLPKALGGTPEQGKVHFERFVEMSGGRDLMGKLYYARDYARLVFDRELHDRLCREVIEADPVAPGLTLSNTLAIEQAKHLLETSAEYFGD